MIVLKSKEEIKIMREAGQIVAAILHAIEDEVTPGMNTKMIDRMAEAYCKKYNVAPAFKGYRGYPANICTSVNEVVVHGIPKERVMLKAGDIVSVDFGVVHKGFCGDAALTFALGCVDDETKKLMKVTEESLYKGIEKARAGNTVGDISSAVQSHAESNGFSVVRELVGHGIGRNMHEEPQIPNYGNPGEGPKLRAGMVLAIEPMVNAGTYEVFLDGDGWTVYTADGKRSAHYEHTVAITENGTEILTKL